MEKLAVEVYAASLLPIKQQSNPSKPQPLPTVTKQSVTKIYNSLRVYIISAYLNFNLTRPPRLYRITLLN